MSEGVKLEGDGMFTTKKVALGRNSSMPEILHRRKPPEGGRTAVYARFSLQDAAFYLCNDFFQQKRAEYPGFFPPRSAFKSAYSGPQVRNVSVFFS